MSHLSHPNCSLAASCEQWDTQAIAILGSMPHRTTAHHAACHLLHAQARQGGIAAAAVLGKDAELLHAGTFSGLLQTAVTTPTELLKIRLQLQTQLPGDPGYVGSIPLLKQVVLREGISGYFGCTSRLAHDGADVASLKASLPDQDLPRTLMTAAGFERSSRLSYLLLQLCKAAVLCHDSQQNQVAVLDRLGCAGLWRGTAVTLVRDWPSFGVYFAVYEGMQEVLQPGSRASGHISPVALLTAGKA